jgi:hypothetical protein
VLEPSQRPHADLRRASARTTGPHRELVQRGAAVRQKSAEACSHDRQQGTVIEFRPALDPLDPAVGEVVARERHHYAAERGGEPPPVGMGQPLVHRVESGDVGHADPGCRIQHGRERNEANQMRPGAIHMVA